MSATLSKGRVQYLVFADGLANLLPAVAARQGGEDEFLENLMTFNILLYYTFANKS